MEETRRMSTAATAAYQAAQVESRIWLSESSGQLEGGWGSEKEEYARGSREGREPHLNTLAWTLAHSRVFLIYRENACAFHLVFAPLREGLPMSLASRPLLPRLCNNVLTYWSTWEKHCRRGREEGGRWEEHRERRWVRRRESGELRGGPYPV